MVFNWSTDRSEKCSRRIDCFKEEYLVNGKQGCTEIFDNIHGILIEFPSHQTFI